MGKSPNMGKEQVYLYISFVILEPCCVAIEEIRDSFQVFKYITLEWKCKKISFCFKLITNF